MTHAVDLYILISIWVKRVLFCVKAIVFLKSYLVIAQVSISHIGTVIMVLFCTVYINTDEATL